MEAKEVLSKYSDGCEHLAEWFSTNIMEEEYEWIDSPHVICINDRYFGVEDIMEVAVYAKQHPNDNVSDIRDRVIDWYDLAVECYQCRINATNIKSWLMGFDKTDRCDQLRKSIKKLTEMSLELEQTIAEAQNIHGAINETTAPKSIKENIEL